MGGLIETIIFLRMVEDTKKALEEGNNCFEKAWLFKIKVLYLDIKNNEYGLL